MDQFEKIPKGVLKDVLIKVGNFIYPIDFVVLETKLVANPRDHISIILGRPFLVTANTLISCCNGVMKLSFGNMTVDLNIFNLGNKSN